MAEGGFDPTDPFPDEGGGGNEQEEETRNPFPTRAKEPDPIGEQTAMKTRFPPKRVG